MGLSKQNRRSCYDHFRKKWVVAHPEEIVRQTWLQRMVSEWRFPPALIAVEIGLRELPHLASTSLTLPDRRVDVVVFAKEIHPQYPLYPLLLIECKADAISEHAFAQMAGYNYYVQAAYMALVNQNQILFTAPKATLSGEEKVRYLSAFPLYEQLVAEVAL